MHEGAKRLRASRRTYASCVCEYFSTKQECSKALPAEYKIDRLVYWEQYKNVNRAIVREKQLKGWRRIKKIQLIVSMNPTWNDLAADWYPELNT
jgi:putative endonuclease